MSGHSKWATIKHKKGAADKARGKLFAKLIRQVEVAAREGGGARSGIAPVNAQSRHRAGNSSVERHCGGLKGALPSPMMYG